MAVQRKIVFRAKDLVFVPDEEEGYVPANVVADFSAGEAGEVIVVSTKEKRTISKKETHLVNRMDAQSYQDESDMVKIKMLNEASLLYNLRLRYFKEPRMEIYTNIGAILVAINPFMDLGLYTQDMEDKYLKAGDALVQMPPHIFKVAEAAMTSMSNEDKDQSCVITGESGAGKTETTKRFLQYISEKSRRNKEAYGGDFGVDTERLRQQILDSNPFMEAFGNAKTLRNDNSSRFGKLIDMSFETSKGVVVGCTITNYLLEKSRVVRVSRGERNYHIFYQLCAAATSTHPDFKKKYHLQGADAFHYCLGLNRGIDDLLIPGESDVQIFEETKVAMNKLNMTDQEIDTTFRICSALLHVGNIDFNGKDKDLAELRTGVEETALTYAADLLAVAPEDLAAAILEREIMKGTKKQHTVSEAIQARDALSKFVYDKMFDWLIGKMNLAMEQGGGKQRRGKARSLAVLDIFGFETFAVNSFEQLCINYCNEQLQSFFNLHVFKKEQKEYMEEGINVETIGFYDNQGVIDAIALGRTSVMIMCDDSCGFEAATDESFLRKIKGVTKEQRDKNAHMYFLFNPKVQDVRKNPHYATAFVVRHFAGFVHYNVEGFIEKNKDMLRKDIRMVLAESGIRLISSLFPDGGDANAGKQGKFKKTLGRKFQASLDLLMQRLNATTPQFVRCIKPNDEKKPDIFTPEKVYKQLNEAGLVEVCKIRKLGYPIKKEHAQFMKDYLCIAKSATDVRSLCEMMMKEGILFETNNSPNWQVGNTRVFLRSEQLYVLDKARGEALKEVLAIIHNFARTYLFRSRVNVSMIAIKDISRGMKNKDPKMLKRGLDFFISKGADATAFPFVQDGLVLMKELQIKFDLINDLETAMKEENFSTIKVKLALAVELDLNDHETVIEAKEMLEKEEIQKEVNNRLETALGEQEEVALEKAIQFAIENGFGGSKLCGHADKMLKTIQGRKTKLEELEQALRTGAFDDVGDIVEELRKVGVPDSHPLIVEAVRKGELVVEQQRNRDKRVEQLERALKRYLKRKNHLRLQQIVNAAVVLQYNGPLIKEAIDMIQILKQRQEYLDEVSNASRVLREKSKMPAGLTESDMLPLNHAIKTALSTEGLDLEEEVQIVEGKKLLTEMTELMEIQEELTAMMKSENATGYYKMLEKVQAVGLQTRAADKLVQKVREMEVLQSKADALSNHERVKEFIEQLEEPDELTRLRYVQMRRDKLYTPEFQMKIKEISESREYAMSAYYKVRANADFVSRERPENREERIQMKHAFEDNRPLTKSMIELDELQDEVAVQISQTITRLCDSIIGRKKDSMESAMSFVVCHGLADANVGDEIYMQLAKHLTGNQNTLSKTKAWHLLCLCSSYFPPQERLLPYVLSFLSHTTSDPGIEGNYARFATAEIGCSLHFNARDENIRPPKAELRAYFERPPVLMQVDIVGSGRVDFAVPPDLTLKKMSRTIREYTDIMINLLSPEWTFFVKSSAKPPSLTWKARLENFYSYYKPSNLGNVDQVLAYYKGQEEQLFKQLTSTSNYGPEPSPEQAAPMTAKNIRERSLSQASGMTMGKVDAMLGDEKASQYTVGSKNSISSVISKVGSVMSRMFRRPKGLTRDIPESINIPSPKVAYPIPWTAYIGDTFNEFYEQNLIPVLLYRRRGYKPSAPMDKKLFNQLRKDYLDGNLIPDKPHDFGIISTLLLVNKLARSNLPLPLGDKDGLLDAGLLKNLPKNIKKERKNDKEWLDGFFDAAIEYSNDLRGLKLNKLQDRFYQRMKELPTYGMSYFLCQMLEDQMDDYIAIGISGDTDNIIKVGINASNMTFFDKGEIIQSFSLNDIEKVKTTGNAIHFTFKSLNLGGNTKSSRRKSRFSIKKLFFKTKAISTGSKRPIKLYCNQRKEMYQLIKYHQKENKSP